MKTLLEIVKECEQTMQCNCDLDTWEPERDTWHSHVCRIHQEAKARFSKQPHAIDPPLPKLSSKASCSPIDEVKKILGEYLDLPASSWPSYRYERRLVDAKALSWLTANSTGCAHTT